MKFLAFLTLAIAAVVAADNSGTCRAKHPLVWTAINRFCAISNLSVPSDFAANGQSNAPKGLARVWIDGSVLNACRPAQWVPKQYCYKQFYAMCAASKDHAFYGKANCQTWRIKYMGPKKGPGAPKVVATKPITPAPGSKPSVL